VHVTHIQVLYRAPMQKYSEDILEAKYYASFLSVRNFINKYPGIRALPEDAD